MVPEYANEYTTENWLDMFDQNQIGYTVYEAQYDINDKLLRIKMDYD